MKIIDSQWCFMNLEELVKEYNKLQSQYGDSSLDSICFGGCINKP